MRLRNLKLSNFGPFFSYEIPFVEEEPVCLLLTGKNNEGKSTIIFALKLIASASQSFNNKQRIVLDHNTYYRLSQQSIENINIGRTLHNYSGEIAQITATFENNLTIEVFLNEPRNLIYADYSGYLPSDIKDIFGFIPPLGPLAEDEEYLTMKHIRASLNTTLAPRHLRNHFAQLLTKEEYQLVQEIINSTWSSIKLFDYEYHSQDNTLRCFFQENKIDRELAWAGQGLQVWFQIVTHLVRLRNTSILVLDEPEINLHAEKQNDLISILHQYYHGSVIIATHSIELMNNVNVSHIIHICKSSSSPKIKSTTDRVYLDLVRSHVGSNFNLVASQFETYDRLIFTEELSDFKIIAALADGFGISNNAFGIPLNGFCEYPKAKYYRDAYKILIGRDIPCVVVLDRDYYPEEHLQEVSQNLAKDNIAVIFTPGKEIENCFLFPIIIEKFIQMEDRNKFVEFWEQLFKDQYLDCYGSYLTLHEKFLPPRIDLKTITKQYTPIFNTLWNESTKRHLVIGGKTALKKLRTFYQGLTKRNLTQQDLINELVKTRVTEVEQMLNAVYG
ncbi:MAG: AAA family ATPase [bacterium]